MKEPTHIMKKKTLTVEVLLILSLTSSDFSLYSTNRARTMQQLISVSKQNEQKTVVLNQSSSSCGTAISSPKSSMLSGLFFITGGFSLCVSNAKNKISVLVESFYISETKVYKMSKHYGE